MEIGFTGTRLGMTLAQRERVRFMLSEMKPEYVHHGDCLGADADVNALCIELGFGIVLHPPVFDKLRAFCVATITLPTRAYIKRNHDIVDATECLIATPSGTEAENPYSGTWATIRYALKIGRPVCVVFPGGGVIKHNGFCSEGIPF